MNNTIPIRNNPYRGRPTNNDRGSNPLTRSYQSNGPDVKVRGTARVVAEKYLELAREAHVGNNPVAAENFLQHAEHYFRLIAAAQALQSRAANGGGHAPDDRDPDDLDNNDVVDALPDRFASAAEFAPRPVVNTDLPRPTNPSIQNRPPIKRTV
jgi:hypothetical protein